MAQQKWEYKFVQFALSRGFKINIYRPIAINDEKLDNWERGPSWQDYFEEQGAAGWEFVTFDEVFLTDTVAGGKLAIFKRPIITEPDHKRQTATFQRIEQSPPPENKPPFVFEG